MTTQTGRAIAALLGHPGPDVDAILAAHQYVSESAGDGYTEPRQDWVGCSCGVLYWDHIQHAGCDCDQSGHFDLLARAPQDHAEHVLAVALRGGGGGPS